MSIINSKEWASWPFFNLLEFWLNYVQNDANSILIIVPDNTLMCICRVAAYDSILFACKLCWMVRGNESIDLFLFHFHIFLLLLGCHDETSVSYQLVLRLWLSQTALILISLLFLWALLFFYLCVIWRWRLRMAIFRISSFILLFVCFWFWSTSWMLIIPLILILRRILLNTLIWLISHSWACSQSIHTTLR